MFELQTLVDVQVLAFGAIGIFFMVKVIADISGLITKNRARKETKEMFSMLEKAIKEGTVEMDVVKKNAPTKKPTKAKTVR